MGVIFDKAMSDDPSIIIRFNEVKDLLNLAEKKMYEFNEDKTHENKSGEGLRLRRSSS